MTDSNKPKEITVLFKRTERNRTKKIIDSEVMWKSDIPRLMKQNYVRKKFSSKTPVEEVRMWYAKECNLDEDHFIIPELEKPEVVVIEDVKKSNPRNLANRSLSIIVWGNYHSVLLTEGLIRSPYFELPFRHHYFENPREYDKGIRERRRWDGDKFVDERLSNFYGPRNLELQYRRIRENEFLRKTIEGYIEARRLYYQIFCMTGYVMKGFESIAQIDDQYTQNMYSNDVLGMVEQMERISQCCYFLDSLHESQDMCFNALQLFDISKKEGGKFNVYKQNVYALLSKNSTKWGEYEQAQKYIEKAGEVEIVEGSCIFTHHVPSNPTPLLEIPLILREAKELLRRTRDDDEDYDERLETVGRFEYYNDVMNMRRRRRVLSLKDLKERVLFLSEEFTEAPELQKTIELKLNFIGVGAKSLMIGRILLL